MTAYRKQYKIKTVLISIIMGLSMGLLNHNALTRAFWENGANMQSIINVCAILIGIAFFGMTLLVRQNTELRYDQTHDKELISRLLGGNRPVVNGERVKLTPTQINNWHTFYDYAEEILGRPVDRSDIPK